MKLFECTDYDLAIRYCELKENKAFEELFKRYYEPVYRFVYSRVLDKNTTEDIVSETFSVLLSVLSSFHKDANMRSFIIGIALNKIRDTWKSKATKFETTLQENLAFIEEGEEDDFNEEALLQKVSLILEKLSEKDRYLLTAKFIQNTSMKEIAEKLNTNQNNIRVMIHRALKRAAQIANTLNDNEKEL